MPAGEALEDDYIISLLQKDADDHKKRYSTVGNGPLLSTTAKRRPDAPKPNTRFLKNIIRETDSHNAALKAKEEQESRARLSELRRQDGVGKRKWEGGDGGKDGKRRKERESRPGRWASALGLDDARGSKPARESRAGKDRRPRRDVGDRDDERSKHRHRQRRERSGEESPERQRQKSDHRSRDHRQRDKSESPNHRKERSRRHRSRSASPIHAHSFDDSDPLTEFLGPQPPPETLPRGRGAFKPSGMDSRFRDDYKPNSDVALEHDEEDDWDIALEALKARTKWRTQGAERLKAAGFTEEEIERWEKSGVAGGGGASGREKDVEDVRWRRKGEGREWDRGKVLDEDEGVEVKAEWAR